MWLSLSFLGTAIMYYEILVNGESIGIVGHPQVLNMHLALQIVDDGPAIFASAVCSENGDRYLIDWLQRDIRPQDVVEFRGAQAEETLPHRKKYKMNRPDEK